VVDLSFWRFVLFAVSGYLIWYSSLNYFSAY
jgi:membrane protein DedA with SNARE-associated domain